MRPPVTIPLDETMIDGYTLWLIFFDCSAVCAKVKPGHSMGEPYFRIRLAACCEYSFVCFMKMSTALIAIGLSQYTGKRGIFPVSINSFSMKRNFCVRSTANAGTITL